MRLGVAAALLCTTACVPAIAWIHWGENRGNSAAFRALKPLLPTGPGPASGGWYCFSGDTGMGSGDFAGASFENASYRLVACLPATTLMQGLSKSGDRDVELEARLWGYEDLGAITQRLFAPCHPAGKSLGRLTSPKLRGKLRTLGAHAVHLEVTGKLPVVVEVYLSATDAEPFGVLLDQRDLEIDGDFSLADNAGAFPACEAPPMTRGEVSGS